MRFNETRNATWPFFDAWLYSSDEEDQIDYLKKHEQEMTDAMLMKSTKSVQWQWENAEVGNKFAMDTLRWWNDANNSWNLIIRGFRFCNRFWAQNTNLSNMGHMLLMQLLRVLKNGGWEIVYDEEGDCKSNEKIYIINKLSFNHEEEMTNYIKS